MSRYYRQEKQICGVLCSTHSFLGALLCRQYHQVASNNKVSIALKELLKNKLEDSYFFGFEHCSFIQNIGFDRRKNRGHLRMLPILEGNRMKETIHSYHLLIFFIEYRGKLLAIASLGHKNTIKNITNKLSFFRCHGCVSSHCCRSTLPLLIQLTSQLSLPIQLTSQPSLELHLMHVEFKLCFSFSIACTAHGQKVSIRMANG